MKDKLIKIFNLKFKPNIITLIVFFCGIVSVVLSYAILLTDSGIFKLIIRDVLQVSILGVIIPIIILSKNDKNLIKAGMRFDKPVKYMLIGIGVSILLLIQFMFKDPEWQSQLSWSDLNVGFYVFIVNIFEVIFFFIFLRYYFEEAFGIIPAIILSAGFYSMHHAGFQPEFIKLFIVGLAFITAFRISNHWLFILPTWWISGLWDVLIGSDSVAEISSTAWISAIIILLVIIIMLILKYPFGKIKENYSIHRYGM